MYIYIYTYIHDEQITQVIMISPFSRHRDVGARQVRRGCDWTAGYIVIHVCVCVYIYIYIYACVYIYIYIYREREIDR